VVELAKTFLPKPLIWGVLGIAGTRGSDPCAHDKVAVVETTSSRGDGTNVGELVLTGRVVGEDEGEIGTNAGGVGKVQLLAVNHDGGTRAERGGTNVTIWDIAALTDGTDRGEASVRDTRPGPVGRTTSLLSQVETALPSMTTRPAQ